jgi:3-isopropylmalate dehydrogenase
MIKKTQFRIAVLPGDGIGPEVIDEGVKVLQAVASRMSGVCFQLEEFSVGAGEYLRSGDPLPEETLDKVRGYDAILLGAMGLPGVRWPSGVEMTPQLDLRERLDLYCGVRPVKAYNALHSPLKRTEGVDFVIVRESTEGLFSERKRVFARDGAEATDVMRITRNTSERLFRAAFRMAGERRGKLTLVDKANVLPSMAYFRGVFDDIGREFPGIETERVYVDAAALFLLQRPQTFDVIVTENMFGDILSDLSAGLVGGMGLAPSADIGDKYAVFQPAHGSAPDIAGKGIANPVATILSVAMMLDWFPHPECKSAARAIESATEKVLADSANRTADLGGSLTCAEMGGRIAAAL